MVSWHKLVAITRRYISSRSVEESCDFLYDPHCQGGYEKFMRYETYLFTPKYARRYVRVHGINNLNECNGGILVFLHYGSFFLSGGALVHQYGLPYALIASRRNLVHLPLDEAEFWKGVHERSARLYRSPIIYSDESPYKIIQWLKKGGFIGAALDVREIATKQKAAAFDFLGARLYLHTGPGRLSVITGRPLIAMTIRYDPASQKHDLYIGRPCAGMEATRMIQESLDAMAPIVEEDLNQFYHDIFGIFSLPPGGSNVIMTNTSHTEDGYELIQ